MPISGISTLGISLQQRSLVNRTQSQIGQITYELGTGFKSDVARSLGSRMSETVELRNAMNGYENYKNSIGTMATRMEVMADALAQIDKYASDAGALLATAVEADSQMHLSIQAGVRSALESMMSSANVNSGDRFMFSGVDINKQPLYGPNEPSDVTGRTPLQTMQLLIGGALPTDAASAQAVSDTIKAAFADDPLIAPDLRFEQAFYGGTPKLDAFGNPNPRISAKSDNETTVQYGIQANDKAFRDILRGLYMVASVDGPAMTKEARDVYFKDAYDAINGGLTQLRKDVAVLGGQQADLDTATERNELRMKLMNERVVHLETADPYEAQARLTVLQQQLQASISITQRLAEMNLAQYMR